MDQENHLGNNRWEGYVDWRNRPAIKGRHGGMLAASFVLAVEVLENLAYLANASNLMIYLSEHMHIPMSESANHVTNFLGTAFLLALLGGFLCDAYCTSYYIFIISATVEFLGLILLTMQARTPSLKPKPCHPATSFCPEVQGGQAALLFAGLYTIALGIGGIKGSLPTHGAEQFDESTPQGRQARSTFFNYFLFALCVGSLIAVTFVVWIDDNLGWQWGLGVSTAAILLSIPVFLAGSPMYRNKVPCGSSLTTIFKVLIAAALNTKTSSSKDEERAEEANNSYHQLQTSSSLSCLNRAVLNAPTHPCLECTAQELEDVKIVIRTLPIFFCTIMLKCCLAQLTTFSLQQASTMNTNLGAFKLSPASLPIFPILLILIFTPIYNQMILPYARRATKTEMGITHLQRVGMGLALSVIAMAVAALIEMKRHSLALNSEPSKPLPMTFFWVAFQYLLLGWADVFSFGGLLEFFFTEAPPSMRSLATSLSWVSLALGYFLSSVIVSIVNGVTGGGSDHRPPWLSGESLNQYKLASFYWLICILAAMNFLHYLFWAKWYKYRSIIPLK